jgi:hypothetical protein
LTGPLYRVGEQCPCAQCPGAFENENDGPGQDPYVLCSVCGYCPEDDFDARIKDCPLCESFAHVINQGNIVCSGCTLELSGDNEEIAIKMWNALPRNPKESNNGNQD